ncbi:NADP-dependent oxidoreductase [Achromobacter xylosoxidans]|uniref:NADP-dependent oxidoreductase n=1 Tax=Alcaligenes xylosoxydans xylosoxydans TaxID=85698 RepID=UPI001EECE0CF|nr:NADP-dependent oxidoreductase [Achromobacter xylosoxidans]
MTTRTREIHLKSRPTGVPTREAFALVETTLAPVAAGQILVRNTWMSVDPYMRGRMVDRKSYIAPFALDAALDGAAVGIVEQSADPAFAIGDHVVHFAGWREHVVLDGGSATRIATDGIAPQTYLGALGFPGLTAYVGLVRIAQARAGETIFVSAASGAVGSTVAQIAKLLGLRVVASVGSRDKAAWLLNEVGVDAVINYREETDLAGALAQAAPEGIDIYFDNVGGEHLEAALAVANDHARFVLCGMIAGYNAESGARGPGNIFLAIEKRIHLQGLIASDHVALFPEFTAVMSDWIRQGKVKLRETVHDGLESAPDAFIGLFKGANTGKMLVRL